MAGHFGADKHKTSGTAPKSESEENLEDVPISEFTGGQLSLGLDLEGEAVDTAEKQVMSLDNSNATELKSPVDNQRISTVDPTQPSQNAANNNPSPGSESSIRSWTESAKHTLKTSIRRHEVPNEYEAKGFFALRDGALESAVELCKPDLRPEDGPNVKGAWLLTEIDHWDNELERLLLITDHSLVVVKFDFIGMVILELKHIDLSVICKVISGPFNYPANSLIPPRGGVGVRAFWNQGRPLSFTQNWNPWCKDIPWVTFTSHPLKHQRERDAKNFDVENFQTLFAETVNAARALKQLEEISIENDDILIENYVGLPSVVHNMNNFGFFKYRGKISF